MESVFLERVKLAFGSLIEAGLLKVESSAYQPRAWANAEVVLVGNGFDVSVALDRGDVIAGMGPAGTADWTPVDRVLLAIGVLKAGATGRYSVDEVAAWIEKHWGALVVAYSPTQLPETTRAIQAVAEEVRREMLDRIRRGLPMYPEPDKD